MVDAHHPPLDLLGSTAEELAALVESWGHKRVHGGKIWRHVHQTGRNDWDAIPDLPRDVVDHLRVETTVGLLPIVSDTGSCDASTRKYLLGLADRREIETVLMRARGRVTACVSSQAGCAMGCAFCATGQMGFGRHLTTAEIVAQALHVALVVRAGAGARSAGPHGARLRNIVLMGMGEPLHNYDSVIAATRILRDPGGLAVGARKITLSTVGVVPGIVRLADERQPIHLAVSLHAATQDEREAIVPVARKWPLDLLLDACRYYATTTQRRIFFEWTLIDGRNDRPEDARAVGRLLCELPAHVNLIPLNRTVGFAGEPSNDTAARRFQATLAEHGVPSTVRRRRGIDIAAGCGQLAAVAPPTRGAVSRDRRTACPLPSPSC